MLELLLFLTCICCHRDTDDEHEAAHSQGGPLSNIMLMIIQIIAVSSLYVPVFSPEGGELVLEDGHHGLCGGDLSPEAEQEQHQEEEHGPDRGHGHLSHRLRIRDEGEPWPLGYNILK